MTPEQKEMLSKMTPDQICRTALFTFGVPRTIIDGLKPGREMDYWVHFVIMNKHPWQIAQQMVKDALPNN